MDPTTSDSSSSNEQPHLETTSGYGSPSSQETTLAAQSDIVEENVPKVKTSPSSIDLVGELKGQEHKSSDLKRSAVKAGILWNTSVVPRKMQGLDTSVPMFELDLDDDDRASQRQRSLATPTGAWQCRTCWKKNSDDALSCSLCNTRKPDPHADGEMEGAGVSWSEISASNCSELSRTTATQSSSAETPTQPRAAPAVTSQPPAGTSAVSTSGGASAQIHLSDLQNILSTMSAVDLVKALSPEAIIPILANPDIQERLIGYLPEGESLLKTEEALRNTTQTPQFKQALSSLGSANQSGQQGPPLTQFGISQVNAAAVGGGCTCSGHLHCEMHQPQTISGPNSAGGIQQNIGIVGCHCHFNQFKP